MLKDIHQHRILILDFGSQYAQLIARRVREIGVYCELMPCDIDEETIRDFNPHGIILSGGPETVTLSHTLRAPAFILKLVARCWVFVMVCKRWHISSAEKLIGRLKLNLDMRNCGY